MIFLKIFGWILLCLLGLIVLVPLVRVDFLIKRDEKGTTDFAVRVLGIKFGGKKKPKKLEKQKKQIKPKNRKSTEKKEGETAFLLKIIGFYEPSSKKALHLSVNEIGLYGVLKEIALSVQLIFQKLAFVLKHIRIRKLHFVCINGGTDAAKTAIEYGQTCSVVYPLLGYVQSAMPGKIKDVKTVVRCDFDREKSILAFDVVLSTRSVFTVWALASLAVKNLVRTNKKAHSIKG